MLTSTAEIDELVVMFKALSLEIKNEAEKDEDAAFSEDAYNIDSAQSVQSESIYSLNNSLQVSSAQSSLAQSLISHSQSHQCPRCGKSFRKGNDLTRHIEGPHGEAGSAVF